MGGAAFPPCYFPGAKLNYGGGNEDNGDLPQKIPCMYCYTQCPQPCSRPPPSHASTGDSGTPTGKFGTVSCGVTSPLTWVMVCKVLLCPPRVYFPVLCKSWKGKKETLKRKLNLKEALFDQKTSSKCTLGRKYYCFCKGIQMDNNWKHREMKVT